MHTIERQITETACIAPAPIVQGRQAYLRFLLVHANHMSRAQWQRLGPEAQGWSLEANKALQKKAELPDFLAPVGAEH